MELSSLRIGDRLIVEHDGILRVAKVAHHFNRHGVRLLKVWLHRQGRVGFCNGTTSKRRQQVVDITYSDYLNIDAVSLESQLIGGGD